MTIKYSHLYSRKRKWGDSLHPKQGNSPQMWVLSPTAWWQVGNEIMADHSTMRASLLRLNKGWLISPGSILEGSPLKLDYICH